MLIIRFDVYMDSDTSSPHVQEELMRDLLQGRSSYPLAGMVAPTPQGKQVRHLPPGRMTDLYLLYCAKSTDPASLSTFKETWNAGWSNALKFRQTSTHSMCKVCHLLKSQLRTALDFRTHYDAMNRYVDHLRAQWADRETYWALRAKSSQGKLLLLATDGMDRSKFCLPRFHEGRLPKSGSIDRNPRPVMECSADLAHGVGCWLYLADENMPIGSAWVSEILSRSIELSWKWHQQKSKALPADLVVFADNTPREVKNSILSRYLTLLTSCSFFRTAGHCHLRVGHTHEDVGTMSHMVDMLVLNL